MKRIVLGVLLSFLGVAVSSEYASGAYFKRLGDLPGGTFESVANNISPDGTAVCGNGQSVSGTEAFRWTLSGRMAGLGDLGGGDFYSIASGVSTDGSVVVGASKSASGTGTETEAFRWTAAGGMVGLGDLAGGVFSSTASGVSADGSVVVGASKSASGTEAFQWTAAGGMVGLGDLTGGDFYSTAFGVSANGSVVVGTSNSASGTEAFRWTAAGGMVGLGDLTGGDFYSTASGVSANGSVVVGASKTASGTEAFRWTAAGGMVGLGYLPGGGPFSSALSASADGSIVVGWSSTATLSKEAFVWDSVNGMRNVKNVLTTTYGLNLVGWDLLEARGVSDGGGTIVGYGTNPEGNIEAWIASLEPSTTPVIGVFRPSTGYWFLDNSGERQWSGCIADDCFYFGMNGDLPAAGDWTGDGIAKIGVFRPATGKWYVDLNGNGQWEGCGVDGCYTFGTNGDMPVAGPWQ
jgi:probable HAF family extracellular repeat protein